MSVNGWMLAIAAVGFMSPPAFQVTNGSDRTITAFVRQSAPEVRWTSIDIQPGRAGEFRLPLDGQTYDFCIREYPSDEKIIDYGISAIDLVGLAMAPAQTTKNFSMTRWGTYVRVADGWVAEQATSLGGETSRITGGRGAVTLNVVGHEPPRRPRPRPRVNSDR
jgi:hypothetical protein